MRVILWITAAIVSSIANGKFLLWQNDPYFAYRSDTSWKATFRNTLFENTFLKHPEGSYFVTPQTPFCKVL